MSTHLGNSAITHLLSYLCSSGETQGNFLKEQSWLRLPEVKHSPRLPAVPPGFTHKNKCCDAFQVTQSRLRPQIHVPSFPLTAAFAFLTHFSNLHHCSPAACPDICSRTAVGFCMGAHTKLSSLRPYWIFPPPWERIKPF